MEQDAIPNTQQSLLPFAARITYNKPDKMLIQSVRDQEMSNSHIAPRRSLFFDHDLETGLYKEWICITDHLNSYLLKA